VSQDSAVSGASGSGVGSQQFLTFKLAGEEYGVGILKVQEIRGWSAVTAIPHAPAWVLGVIDLRGVVVPVIDLRRRFDLEPAHFGPATVVSVIRVYDIDESSFRALPDLGSTAASDVVQGLAHTDGKTVILLDAERLSVGASTH
jgi:purine-binding chemotaxis protein CheW